MISYKNILIEVLKNGEQHDDRTNVGTLSLFGANFSHDMSNGFPLLTTKKVHFKSVAEELFWFLSGSTDNRHLQAQGVTIWNEWSDLAHTSKFNRPENDLGPVYGWQWRRFGQTYPADIDRSKAVPLRNGFDQINWVLNEIIDNPNSRRLIVSAWNPSQQLDVELPPCHTLFQFKVQQGNKLSLHVYMRSCDLFLGFPFNLASYALLLELFCRITCKTAGKLHFSFGDLHIYKNHMDQVNEQLTRPCRLLPTLDIRMESFRHYTNPLDRLLSITYADLTLNNYNPHPAIKAPIAI